MSLFGAMYIVSEIYELMNISYYYLLLLFVEVIFITIWRIVKLPSGNEGSPWHLNKCTLTEWSSLFNIQTFIRAHTDTYLFYVEN